MKKSPISSRKAQDASSAAALVAIIALLIIFYLLFIPPDYRDQILEGNGTNSGISGTSSQSGQELLKASPGTLSPIDSEKIEHNIPSVTLYAKTSSTVLQTQSGMYIKASIFGQKKATMNFDIENIDYVNNLLLTFISKEHRGNMVVKLNGNEVFSGEITKENPEPMRLPTNYLRSGQNTLEFESEKPGWMFWRRNRQQMESIQLTADIKDISRQQSENIFIVSATEKSNVKRAILRFTPDCRTGSTGKLNVLVNSHSVYYAVPDCGGRIAIEFTPDVFREGENVLVFDSEQGSYLIDLIRITSELKEVIQPTYYFDITEEDMQNIRDGDYNIMLKATFVEDREMKSAKVNANGREFNIYQTEREFEKNLNDYVVEGNNAIKILPETTMEVVSLKVVKE